MHFKAIMVGVIMFVRPIDETVSLALVQPTFAKHYYQIVCREREYLSEWLAWPMHANGEAFFEAFIKSSLHDYAEGKSITCAMLYRGEIVGNISFNTINHDTRRVDIGYWLSQDFQGKGIATRCMMAMISIAFDELGMEKVAIAAAIDNQPSRRLCERLGFTLEGEVGNAENLNGRIVSHALYGLYRK